MFNCPVFAPEVFLLMSGADPEVMRGQRHLTSRMSIHDWQALTGHRLLLQQCCISPHRIAQGRFGLPASLPRSH
jgi:hypothetical protein